MEEKEIAIEQPPPWYHRVAMGLKWFLLLPILLPVLFILLLFGIVAFFQILVSELSFSLRMRQCGRFLHWRQLGRRMDEQGAGTLIIESPSLGWGYSHAWWTPDKIQCLNPYPIPTDDEYRLAVEKRKCSPWDQWNWENYTDPVRGRGFLMRVWNDRSLENWVKQNFPPVEVVHTWTALVHYPKLVSEQDGE